MKTHRVHRASALHVAPSFLMMAALTSPALAGDSQAETRSAPVPGFEKEVNWLIDPGGADKDKAKGAYSLRATAHASCWHRDVPHLPDPVGDDFLLKDGLGTEDMPISTALAYAQAFHQIIGQGQASAFVRPIEVQNDGKWKITGKVKAPVSASGSDCDKGSGSAQGTARSSVSCTVDGKTYQQGIDRIAVYQEKKGKGSTRAAGAAQQDSEARTLNMDPIWVEYFEPLSGTLVHEELFSLEIAAARGPGDFEWAWDSSGIVLSAPRSPEGAVDGSILITADASSDWLVSPLGAFGATLIDGVFAATGIWSGLAWELTYDGADVVAARLPAAAFDPALTLDYQAPDGVLTPGAEYNVTLGWEEMNIAEIVVVPAPATTMFVSAAGLLLAGRRRR